MVQDRLVLIDGYSLMHRAFYALPALTNSQGEYTNAVFGFFSMLLKVVKEAEPSHLCVALDAHAPTFRHEAYAAYKGTRKPMPEELRPQLGLLRQALGEMGVAWTEAPGFEADDIIGTLSAQAEERGLATVIVTGDRDSFQLIGGNTQVWFTKKGISETEKLDEAALRERYGLAPWQVPDLKGLMGDSSDNIPGIAGIGEKTALRLLGEYGSLEETLAHADQVKGKLGEKLRAGVDQARMSRQLAVIRRDAPLQIGLDQLRLPPLEAARPVFRRLEFGSLLERLPQPAQMEPDLAQPEDVADLQALRQLAKERQDDGFGFFVDGDFAYLGLEGGPDLRIRLQGDLLNPGLDVQELLQALSALFQGGGEKRLFDAKSLRTRLKRLGIDLGGACFDAALAQYLLEPGGSPTAASLLSQEGKGLSGAAFCALCRRLGERLRELGMWELFHQVEQPLSKVLFEMEQEGFKVDRPTLLQLQKDFGEAIARLQAEAYEACGQSFNLNSPKQLGELLFETLGLPSSKKTKSGYSTDAEVLEAIQEMHPVVPLVLQFRTLSKLKSTYIDGLLKLSDQEGIVHTTLNQTVTVTGRISSAEPNLQNIPVRTELGREIRKVFVPRQPGRLLVDADYSQIELRVLAHMAGEENMIRAFRQGQDIHAQTAAKVYGVALDQVSPAMRSSAKAVNFGIVYGISDFGLAKNIGVSRREAADFIERYFAQYPAVRAFMDRCVKTAKEQGYVTTLLGRRRVIPELRSSNYNTRSFGERAAMNTPVQGSAADIIKVAMVRVHRALQEEGLRAKLILQVHDELIVDAPAEEAQAVERLLKREMEGAYPLDAPLVADVKSGASWYETK